MSWYHWHQASFAICLLSPFLRLSSSSFFKPICSTFAIITCLPSLWHIRGSRQAPFTPLSLLPLTPLSSRPYFCTHFATEFSKWSRWHLALLSSWNQDGKQRSAVKRSEKAPENYDVLLKRSCLNAAELPVPTGSELVCCCSFHASSSSGWLLLRRKPSSTWEVPWLWCS